MRLFAALDLPEQVLEEAAAWHAAACVHLPAGRWRDIPARNWHLTLAFYGDVGGEAVDALAEALAECALNAPPLRLCFSGFGAFPGLHRPNVFWLGVGGTETDAGLKALARCCRRAGRATVRRHSAKETPFRAHVTVARRRGNPVPLSAEAMARMPDVPDVCWQAEVLRLYRSELHRDRARYFVLEEFALSADAD